MKKYLALLPLVLGLAATQPAQATLMVTLTDGVNNFHCVDNAGACDFSGAASNLLTLNNTVGAFNIFGTISVSQIGLTNLLSLVNFGATNNGSKAGTLSMYVSDTGFTGPVSGIGESAGILFSNAVGSGPSTLDFYADTANVQGANLVNTPGTLLASVLQTPTTNPQSFSGNDFTPFSDSNLFSMTMAAHINLIGGGSFTGFDQNMQSVVPIPAAMPLFAGGLGVLGAVGRWRKRRKSDTTAIAA